MESPTGKAHSCGPHAAAGRKTWSTVMTCIFALCTLCVDTRAEGQQRSNTSEGASMARAALVAQLLADAPFIEAGAHLVGANIELRTADSIGVIGILRGDDLSFPRKLSYVLATRGAALFRLGGFAAPEFLEFSRALPQCSGRDGQVRRAILFAKLAIDSPSDSIVAGIGRTSGSESWQRLFGIMVATSPYGPLDKWSRDGIAVVREGTIIEVLAFAAWSGGATPYASQWLLDEECLVLGWRSTRLGTFAARN